MIGRTPGSLTAIRPMRNGVIADFAATELLLSHFMHKAHRRSRLVRPWVVIGVPSEVTAVEREAVIEAASRAGASEVYLVEQAVVAALGAGLPITEAAGSMVVDIGGGTTDVAVLALSGIVYSHSIRTAGDTMDEAIIHHVRRRHGLLIGERTAETIKLEVGSAHPVDRPLSISIKGRDLINGLPRAVTIEDEEIRQVLSECLGPIMQCIRAALECIPPELSGDIIEQGIMLTGGCALLRNLDQRIRLETGLPVTIAESPLASVVMGTARMLEDLRFLQRAALN
jgi:rod shape-determining protein MreB